MHFIHSHLPRFLLLIILSVAIPLTIFITLHRQHYRQEAAGNSSTGISSLAPPQHIIGGFGINTTERAMDAAKDGIQSTILYGNPPDASSTLGQTLASHNIKIIDSMPWELLYKYENNKSSYTIQNMLTEISNHLQQTKNDLRIIGYWTLDDWPYADHNGKDLLVQINDLIHQITPGKPSICGFGGSLWINDGWGWDDDTAANFSPQGCDMVGLYIYVSSSDIGSQPVDTSGINWTMQGVLPAIFASLKIRGWDIKKEPMIGIPQAFGGSVGGRYWQQPNAQTVEIQTKTFCQNGATGIIYYAWDNSEVTSTSMFPWNNTSIAQGIRNGLADCKAIWNNISASPTANPSLTPNP